MNCARHKEILLRDPIQLSGPEMGDQRVMWTAWRRRCRCQGIVDLYFYPILMGTVLIAQGKRSMLFPAQGEALEAPRFCCHALWY